MTEATKSGLSGWFHNREIWDAANVIVNRRDGPLGPGVSDDDDDYIIIYITKIEKPLL